MNRAKRTRISFSFRSKNQLPFFMVIKEYYDENGQVYFAKVLFEIKGRKFRKLLKKSFGRATDEQAD